LPWAASVARRTDQLLEDGDYIGVPERIVFGRFLTLRLPISLAQLLAAAYSAGIGCTGWGRGIGQRLDPRSRPPNCF
jgi:hypothetical protein